VGSFGLHFFPIALPFLFAFVLLVGFLIALIEIGILRYTYEKIGIQRRYIFALLIGSLLGSYLNIPVAELPAERVLSSQEVPFFGMRYIIPFVQEWPRTIVAVNVGGAIVPAIISIYLLVKNRLYVSGAIGTAVVATVVYMLAQPIEGVGIAVPTIVPPLVAALAALLLSRRSAPPLAYIAGSLGTLIGADLLNIGQFQGLGSPIVSIGGAGTFDGIFLTGVIAVLLCSPLQRKTGKPAAARKIQADRGLGQIRP
jgi:uncharacterized membrane protein